jgi:hypothetical protein
MHWLRIDRYYSESTFEGDNEKIIFLVYQVHCLHLTKYGESRG